MHCKKKKDDKIDVGVCILELIKNRTMHRYLVIGSLYWNYHLEKKYHFELK